MKRSNYPHVILLMCSLGLLAGGCLFKSAPAQARHFILTPIPPPEQALAATSQAPAIDVGFVKMPSYLLREFMVIRKSASEYEVLDNAIWAEQLDEGFRRVLQDNLSSLLASDQGHLSATGRKEGKLKLSVDVQQFDVDTQGRGTLRANWRISEPGAASPLKRDEADLTRSGPAPRGDPQAMATTLSGLIEEFSRQVAAGVPGDAGGGKQ